MTARQHSDIDKISPVLFLDYDGVLHPGPDGRGDVELFAYTPQLEAAIEPYPQVAIVLSTSWVEGFGFDEARECLPESLQRRVVGATYHSRYKREMHPMWWSTLTRYGQIAHYLNRHGITRWLALDDDGEGWPPEQRRYLVRTPGLFGLSYPDAQSELADKLKRLCD